MGSSTRARSLLEKLREHANQSDGAKFSLKDWNRRISWNIAGEHFYWSVENGHIQFTTAEKADFQLTCTPATLEKLVTRELPFFIGLWVTGDLQFEGAFSDAFRLGYIFLSDNRKRRVVFLAHCFLNTNTRFPGGCAFGGATVPLIEVLLQSEVGIIQLPCPEFLCLGLEKHQYGEIPEPELRTCFRTLAQGVLAQIREYVEAGYEIVGIIGMNPSPSCGVEVTKGKGTMLGVDRDTSEKAGAGVFIEELQQLAQARGFGDLPFFGVRRILPGEGGLTERLNALKGRLAPKDIR